MRGKHRFGRCRVTLPFIMSRKTPYLASTWRNGLPIYVTTFEPSLISSRPVRDLRSWRRRWPCRNSLQVLLFRS